MQLQEITLAKVSSFRQIIAAALTGDIRAASAGWRQKSPKALADHRKLVPLLYRTESGRVAKLEKFSHYVARQLGFEGANEVPELCKLANEYLRESKGFKESIFEYFSNEKHADSLFEKLIDEFDRCILSYFSFHWNQAASVIAQVLNTESEHKTKLKEFLLEATRKQRFERISRNLKVTRVFSTLVEEMKAIKGDSQSTDLPVPVAHGGERSPVLLLMGGGMGAGKSTVLKDILKEPFWAEAASHAVVVEADSFKENDVIYRALSSRGHHHDMLQTAELVHQSSTEAASSLLVTALNEGRDVIMDSTLSWEPFVEQTIAMARNVHKCRYRMGVGYRVSEDGTVTENYWEQVNEEEEEEPQQPPKENGTIRKPYRIELVGVVCDGYLAVVRGIRRAIKTSRAVRVNSQLVSHKRFANAFPKYCKLVDNAKLYNTNNGGHPPKLIGLKEGEHKQLLDLEELKCLERIASLNTGADSIYELYSQPNPITGPDSMWDQIVSSPSRSRNQKELRESIQKIEINSKH